MFCFISQILISDLPLQKYGTHHWHTIKYLQIGLIFYISYIYEIKKLKKILRNKILQFSAMLHCQAHISAKQSLLGNV
jgi:hypothetical protein